MMKFAVVLLALLLAPALPARAQTAAEKTGVNALLDRPPAAADLLLGLHQFDLFQQEVGDSADKRGDAEVKKIAVALADDAKRRGNDILAVQKKAGLALTYPDDPSTGRSNRLGGLEGSVAEVYVRLFYRQEINEHETAIALLQRYLRGPDNDAVKSFAERQSHAFETSLGKIRDAASRFEKNRAD